MNELDWLIVIIVAFSALMSLLRGFVKEAFSLLTWLVALFVGLALSPNLAQLLSNWLAHEVLRMIVAFLCLFLVTLIIGGVISSLVVSLVSKTGLGPLDRLLGTVFGALRGAVIIMAVLLVVQPFIVMDDFSWWRESHLIPHFLRMEDWAKSVFGDVSQWRYDLIRSAQAVNGSS